MYGPCREAGRAINPWEQKEPPISRQELCSDTAPIVEAYLRTAIAGLSVPRLLHRTTNLLWIVDDKGRLWFAVEEVVHRDTGVLLYTYPRTRALKIPDDHVKLGHPSLLDDPEKRARIGGEIEWNHRYQQWVIINRSGRYGERPWQTLDHLVAVNRKFNEFGIDFRVVFWPEKEEVQQ